MRTAILATAVCVLSACGSDGTAPDILTLTLTAPKQTIAVGEPVQLTVVARDVNGVTIPNARITYTSSSPTIASVNTAGQVLGISLGTATVMASSGVVTSQPVSFDVVPGNVGAVFSMQPNSFSPTQATIRVGQSVLFDFPPSLLHNVIFKDRQQHPGAPEDIQQTQNQRITRTFNTAGTFPFDCTLHPGMSGSVIVNP